MGQAHPHSLKQNNFRLKVLASPHSVHTDPGDSLINQVSALGCDTNRTRLVGMQQKAGALSFSAPTILEGLAHLGCYAGLTVNTRWFKYDRD